jgi:hypothetical protein
MITPYLLTGTNGANIFEKGALISLGTIQLMPVMPIYIHLFKCHFPATARIPLYALLS